MSPDTESIDLNEIEDHDVMLSLDEAAELQDAGLKINFLPFSAPNSATRPYRINGNHNVGHFRLKSGRLVRIESKVPIANIFSLLAVAYPLYERESPFLERTVSYSSVSRRPLQALVEHFIGLVDTLLRQGLLRRYIEQEDNLSTIRGRLLFRQQIRQNLIIRNKLFCRFTIADVDNVENRIILWTLILLHRCGSWPDRIRRTIQTQIMHFAGVSVTSVPSGHVPTLVYDRLSTRYRVLHQWCRFFIDQMSLRNVTGEVEFHGFRLNMFRLFERFAFCVFQEAARKRAGTHVDKSRSPLDTLHRVNILPDIMITNPYFLAVGDVKYKITKDNIGRHPDLYQVMAYAMALGLLKAAYRPQAFLIYPAFERVPDLDGDMEILTSFTGESSLSVRILWFDLNHSNVFGHAVTMADALFNSLLKD